MRTTGRNRRRMKAVRCTKCGFYHAGDILMFAPDPKDCPKPIDRKDKTKL